MNQRHHFNFKALLPYFKEREESFIRFLEEMVSYRTLTGDSETINRFLDFVQSRFDVFQPVASRIPTGQGDILELSFFPENEDFLVLLAHSDTARVTEFPYSCKLEKERFFANGCYDMKAGIALFYCVLSALAYFGLEPSKQIKVILTPDEEAGSRAGLPYLLQACQGALAVLLPEPCCPGGAVKSKRKGVAWQKIDIKGKAVHSGIEPQKGCDANRALARLIVEIDGIVTARKDVTFNPGLISGGTGLNVVSPKSTVEFELRSFSNDSIREVIERIEQIQMLNGVSFKMESQLIIPALEYDEKNRNLFEKAQQIASLLGVDLQAGSSGGCSEGSHLSFAGIPVLDGIGIDGGGAHAPGEYIEIKDFPFRAALLTALSLEI